MELVTIDLDDLPLYERIYCDPRMMEHLGGPLAKEGLPDKLRRDVAAAEAGEVWILKIVPDEADGAAAGSVSVWDHSDHGEPITEIGWSVFPEFQGRGLATRAVREVLNRIRAAARWQVVHAFPPVTNAASNAMCHRLGFTNVGQDEYVFRGRSLRCNIWRVDLRTTDA